MIIQIKLENANPYKIALEVGIFLVNLFNGICKRIIAPAPDQD